MNIHNKDSTHLCNQEGAIGANQSAIAMPPQEWKKLSGGEAAVYAAIDHYLRDQQKLDPLLLAGAYHPEVYADCDNKITMINLRFELPGHSWWDVPVWRADGPLLAGRFRRGDWHEGHWWQLPGRNPECADELWIAEGIFEATRLAMTGKTAVAMLDGHYPHRSLRALSEACYMALQQRPTLVWAIDAQLRTRLYRETAERHGWACRVPMLEGTQ